jgi:diguanylate cyclase (GGDEF)-like protein
MAAVFMHLDVGTLSVVTVFVMALLGALLLFAGVQNRTIRAPLWWGAAQLAGAAGLGLTTPSGVLPAFVSIDIANALVLLAYGLTWAGARDFDGRKVLPLVVVFAPVVWLFACRMPVFEANTDLRAMVVSAMTAMLAAATAEELWRGRAEPLLSRWPTVIVLLAYAAVLLARIPATFFAPALGTDSLLSVLSFALIAFGTLLFTVVMSFLLLNMTKERTELQHKINALVDPLSGVANRRAFLEGARRLMVQQTLDGEPLAMMLFDLDRFKEINDRMGHAVGDRVLQTFAAASTATLGADILFGRIGGEEFAALFPVGDVGEAYAVADRVRRNFIEAAGRSRADRQRRRDRRNAQAISGCRARELQRRENKGGHVAGGRRPRTLPGQGQRPKSRRGNCRAGRYGNFLGMCALDRAADQGGEFVVLSGPRLAAPRNALDVFSPRQS